jgi:protoheme IX farnesyltransferase
MVNLAAIRDYLTLCKPKVVLLMLITAWVGMYMASPNSIPWPALSYGTIGIAFAASAAAIINHLMDRHIDQKMSRTAGRPIASGRVAPLNALIFASVLALIAWILLSRLVNIVTAILTFSTLFGYAVVYTLYLKRATPQNIVIGGLSGAMPPLLGWAAVSGDINPHSLLLVLIIFVWTPPHFWALAIYRVNDYAAAKIPMLPVTHGIAFTKTCLLLYTILLSTVTVLPFVFQMSSLMYLITACVLNIIFLYFALRLYMSDAKTERPLAIQTFNYSLLYLLLIFSALLIDHKYEVINHVNI